MFRHHRPPGWPRNHRRARQPAQRSGRDQASDGVPQPKWHPRSGSSSPGFAETWPHAASGASPCATVARGQHHGGQRHSTAPASGTAPRRRWRPWCLDAGGQVFAVIAQDHRGWTPWRYRSRWLHAGHPVRSTPRAWIVPQGHASWFASPSIPARRAMTAKKRAGTAGSGSSDGCGRPAQRRGTVGPHPACARRSGRSTPMSR
jgi:hypothetical protein